MLDDEGLDDGPVSQASFTRDRAMDRLASSAVSHFRNSGVLILKLLADLHDSSMSGESPYSVTSDLQRPPVCALALNAKALVETFPDLTRARQGQGCVGAWRVP